VHKVIERDRDRVMGEGDRDRERLMTAWILTV
jgi:hypothetical protein